MAQTTQTVHATNLKKIEVGKNVQGEIFLVDEFEIRQTRTKKDFFDLTIKNKTGKCNIKIFDPHEILNEGDFIEVYMEGKDHPKWGKQWDVSHYVKSDYPGDEGFGFEELDYDPSYPYQMLQSFAFEDLTCRHLHHMWLEKEIGDQSRDLSYLNSPASKIYYSKRYGLLKYTDRVVEATKCYWSDPSISNEVLRISALLHHSGSLECFEPEETTNKFRLNDIGLLYDPGQQTSEYLQGLRQRALMQNKPIDGMVYRLVERTCLTVFNKKPVSLEGIVLLHAHQTAIEIEALQKQIDKAKDTNFIVFSSKAVINIKGIMDGKKEESKS